MLSSTPKKPVKPSAKKPDISNTCRLCFVDFKSSGRYRVSTENLFKIPQKSGVSSTPLAELVGKHVGVVILQDTKKSSRVCAKCALKIRNASSICEFIKAALDSENTTYVESGGDPRFKRLNVISPPRNVKKSRPYSSPMPKAKQSRKTSPSPVSRAENEPENRRRAKRSMLFNGNDDMARDADLGHTLNITLDSDDLFESSGEASADFPLNMSLDDVGCEEKDRSQKKINVDVTLDFPSGQCHKRVPDDVSGIVKNFAISNFKAAVHLIFKCKELRPFIEEALKSAISSELKEYCQSDNSLLKHTSPAELAAFSNKLVCHEVSVMCPLWNAALRAAAGCHRSKAKSDKAVNVLALCSASVAKFRHQRMSALAYRISVILLHSGAKSQDFTRLNRLGISVSHKSTIAKQKEMAKEHDSLVLTWKNKIETAKRCESLLQEVKEKQEPVPVETSDENDMEIDVYDLNQSTLASYDFFSPESYEICKGMLASSPTATPAALEVAVSSAADKFRLLPRYR